VKSLFERLHRSLRVNFVETTGTEPRNGTFGTRFVFELNLADARISQEDEGLRSENTIPSQNFTETAEP